MDKNWLIVTGALALAILVIGVQFMFWYPQVLESWNFWVK